MSTFVHLPAHKIEPREKEWAIAGTGRKLLDGLPAIRLTPIRSAISPTGYLMLDYRLNQ